MKIYLRSTGNLVEQAKVYLQCFGGKIYKQTASSADHFLDKAANNTAGKYDFVYLLLNNEAKVMLANHKASMPPHGYQNDIVIECSSKANFEEIYHNLKQHSAFRMDYDITAYPQ